MNANKTDFITVRTDLRFTKSFVAEIFENYPEAGAGQSIVCKNWHNRAQNEDMPPEEHHYTFLDVEENKVYKVTWRDMVRGFRKFIRLKNAGELKGCPWACVGNGEYDYDATTTDAICQLAIFGEVRYG